MLACEFMDYALEISDLNKSYLPGVKALDAVDLKVEQGDFFALLGPNGAGKSTLISIICSLVRKDSGQVKIFGHDIDKNFSAAKMALGVVPQEFNFNTFEKVRDIVVNQAGYYGIPKQEATQRSEHYLDKLGLWNKRDTVSRQLSGGMKRRLMIARALIHQPKLLVLDEPTAGVDIELRRTMWQFIEEINAQGTSIILTTHYLEEAEALCRNVAIIRQGKIIERSGMQTLLASLNKETFIFDVENLSDLTDLGAAFDWVMLPENRLSVSIDKHASINSIFRVFDEKKIQIKSMRNKSNRLEELFVTLVRKPSEEHQ